MAIKETALAALSENRESLFRLLKFLVSGGTAAFVELLLLYVLTQFFGIWYLFSSILAFIVSFWVSFLSQKFWTFEDAGTHRIHKQASLYLFVALANLGINAAVLYILVQFFGIWYLLAQAFVIAGIAVSNFFIYRLVIFKKEEMTAC